MSVPAEDRRARYRGAASLIEVAPWSGEVEPGGDRRGGVVAISAEEGKGEREGGRREKKDVSCVINVMSLPSTELRTIIIVRLLLTNGT